MDDAIGRGLFVSLIPFYVPPTKSGTAPPLEQPPAAVDFVVDAAGNAVITSAGDAVIPSA